MLIERCEVRLQKSESFAPADWRSYSERPRWVDSRRGWTGLRPEEVVVRAIDTAKGEEIGSEEKRREKSLAGLRARYARSFPRAADRGLIGDRGQGEVVRADGIENTYATP